MPDRTIKQGDTYPPLRGRAADENGALPIDTATGIRVLIKGKDGTLIVNQPATVINPPDAKGNNWKYDWHNGDTDVPGTYKVELEIQWPAGVQTVPVSGFQTLRIAPDLGGTRG